MFSPEQYQALRHGAARVGRGSQGQLSLTGTDRRSFLQGLLTNDIAALQPGTGCYAAMLTANGRMIADMRVFELGDAILLDTGAGLTAALRDRLDQSIFSEDCQVEDVSATVREIGVYGPLAGAVVARAIGPGVPADWDGGRFDRMEMHASLRVDTAAGRLVIVRSDEVGVPGFDLFVGMAGAAVLIDALEDGGAVEARADAVETTRIEGGRPRFGTDMGADTIPLEAGIEDRAISLTKGCYVGQEIIIRVLHRGGGRVARRLVGLTLDPSCAVPTSGDAVRSGDRQLGQVTSSTFSPALARPIAMAYVHRDFVDPGTPLTVVSGGREEPAVVVSLPFLEAPAGSTR